MHAANLVRGTALPQRMFPTATPAPRPANRALSSLLLPAPQPRLPPFPATAAAAEGLEGYNSDLEASVAEELDGFRERDHGYTPFEFIDFTSTPLKHEVSIRVNRPVEHCYSVWDNRLNWMQWFEMIDEVGFHEEHPAYISMYLWYRWATTPFLELYVTLERTKSEVNKFIMEEPVEGMPLVAAVLFHEEEGNTSATVTLRISYLLPKVLEEFAGQLAVYGDVDRKLQKCMAAMKDFVETADLAELEEIRKINSDQIQSNFAEQRQRKAAVKRHWEKRGEAWETSANAAVGGREQEAAAAAAAGETEEGAESRPKATRRGGTAGAAMSNPMGTRKRAPRKKKAEAEVPPDS